ncbi:replication protein [Cyclospora cayetanensis]|uniref:Replication protein n=1 Tax=Cyclospora cayetanensis TaxID=88456 RepID=A0A1D3CVQ7_9EIME|nr:replication protein [Cyclospora cayetanensis]
MVKGPLCKGPQAPRELQVNCEEEWQTSLGGEQPLASAEASHSPSPRVWTLQILRELPYEDYFGGGGFLQTGNFLTQAQQPSGPQLSLIPVKIAHVFKAWMQDASSLQISLFPSGPLLHLVKLVGVLNVPPREALEAALQTARLQFSLDDFTGRIECEYTVGDELTEFRQNQILDALCCGGLVTAFGSINLLGKSEPSLRVHAIRQTQSAAPSGGTTVWSRSCAVWLRPTGIQEFRFSGAHTSLLPLLLCKLVCPTSVNMMANIVPSYNHA